MHVTYYTYIYLYLNGYVDDASTVIATDKQRDRSIVCLLDQIIAILAKQSQRLRTIDSADEKKIALKMPGIPYISKVRAISIWYGKTSRVRMYSTGDIFNGS